MKNLILLLLLTFCSSDKNYQNVIERLSKEHQACLDTGVNMLGCSRKFYFEMDSMLNVVYREYRSSLTESGKKILKNEQLNWLKKRDEFFAKENKEYQKNIKSQEWGPDMYMIVYDNNADFVKERTLELITQMKTKK